MKIIVTILSVYLTSLTIFPCADALLSDNCGTEIHFHDADNQENHSDTKDNCTPLCQCQCCGVQVTTYQPGNIYLITRTTADLQYSYLTQSGKEYNNTPFHPPQV